MKSESTDEFMIRQQVYLFPELQISHSIDQRSKGKSNDDSWLQTEIESGSGRIIQFDCMLIDLLIFCVFNCYPDVLLIGFSWREWRYER